MDTSIVHRPAATVNGWHPDDLGDAHEGDLAQLVVTDEMTRPATPARRRDGVGPQPLTPDDMRALNDGTLHAADDGEHYVLRTYTAAELATQYPQLRSPVIHGLLRLGETMNLIAAPKTGKSWLALSLAFAVARGDAWMGYGTAAGDVLLIDNELHVETLAARLRRVAEHQGIDLASLEHRLTILPLRGRLQSLPSTAVNILSERKPLRNKAFSSLGDR